MNNYVIKQSLRNLNKYCLSENYKGYSLYDSHNSPFQFHKLGKTISFLVNQINKRSPINFRRILKIKKGYNPKGMGLFLYAYVLQKKIGNPVGINNLDKLISLFFKWLKLNPSKNYSRYCWGYNYPWPKTNGLLIPRYTPSSVVTGFNIRAVFQYYLISKDKRCLELIKGAENFILNDIHLTKTKNGVCFSYTPLEKDMTLNASLIAAEVLAYADYVFKKNDNQGVISKAITFTMNYQNQDGSWYYAIDPESGKPDKQIDFHQGYILETIKNICDYSEIDIELYNNQLKSGLSFYRSNQFTDDGVSYWRIPKKWPVDIHNQSQGIITFSMFKDYDPEYLGFAEKIATWTIKNMQDPSGSFYYQKWPLLTNKIDYMRWNQGWMTLSLTRLLFAKQ